MGFHGGLRTPRSAFTLVELLVVLGIIALLAAITAGATIGVMAFQRGSVSEARIKSLVGILERQWKAVVDQARNETPPQAVLNMAGGDPRRAKVIWIKLRLKQQFPQNFSEAFAPWALPPSYANIATYPLFGLNQAYLPSGYPRDVIAAGSADPAIWPRESMACLLLSLQKARGGLAFSEDNLQGAAVVQDPLRTTLKTVVDGWGQPLYFYRWPTDNLDVVSSNPSPSNAALARNDPLDPEGLLIDPAWNNWASYQAQQGVWWFEQYCHPIHAGTQNTYSPLALYNVPTIASSGRNNILGYKQASIQGLPYPSPLLPDLMSLDPAYADKADDNILSVRMRLGARGD